MILFNSKYPARSMLLVILYVLTEEEGAGPCRRLHLLRAGTRRRALAAAGDGMGREGLAAAWFSPTEGTTRGPQVERFFVPLNPN